MSDMMKVMHELNEYKAVKNKRRSYELAFEKLVDKIVLQYGINRLECSKIVEEDIAPKINKDKKQVRFE